MDATQAYIKYFFILANIALTFVVIASASFIISPLIAALVVSILLNPLFTKLIKIGIPKIISAGIAVLTFLLGILLLVSFITSQIRIITADPNLSSTLLSERINLTLQGLAKYFKFSLSEINESIVKAFNNFFNSIITYVPNIFANTITYLSMFLLFFISLFFFLYYRDFFMNFIQKLVGKKHKDRVNDTADKIDTAIKNYIVGLFRVIFIIAILNSVGLLILGVPYAVFFGITAALLTLIPYLGIFIGSLIPATYMFFITDSFLYPFMILLVFLFIQILEGNFITPYIIGSQENVNPYIAILGLFVGGFLLGAVGVIFAIPLLGIAKIICDDIDFLTPIGYVLGNPRKESNSVIKWITKLFNKNK